MEKNLLVIAIFFGLGIALPVVALAFGRLLRPSRPKPEKLITYESGVDPFHEGQVQFHVRYYLFALLFVVFDVESVFLYPWALIYNFLRTKLGLFVLIEMAVFLGVLVLGLIYAWKKKVLEWE